MKKLLLILFALVLCLFVFAACGESCVAHKFGEWMQTQAPTKTEKGVELRICSVCSETEEHSVPALGSVGLTYMPQSGTNTCIIMGIGTCTDTEIYIPEKIGELTVIGIKEEAFKDCTTLTSIEIPSSVTSIGRLAFSGCTSLTSIKIPSSVTSIGDHVFFYCTSLTSIKIPGSVTSIGDRAFDDCTSLASVTFGDNSQLTSIGDDAFYYCTSLTSINIPYGVKSIGEYAFYHCSSLTSIEIPGSVTRIGESAFCDCTRLIRIDYTGTKAQWNAISKGFNWKYNTTGFIVYCTDGNISIG